MSQICGTLSTEDPTTGAARPAMLDPTTSCGLWYGALMTSLRNNAPSGGQLPPGFGGLDAAVQTYCGANPGAQGCACVAFPQLAKSFCTTGPFACELDGVCAASLFAQTSGDTFEVVSFGQCNPYPCWLEACTTPNDSQMLRTSTIAAMPFSGSCSSHLCIQESSGNSAALGPTLTPLPAGSFQVGDLVQSCQTGATNPPVLATAPVDVGFAANATMQLGTLLANNGDWDTTWSVTSTPAWVSTSPASGILGGNTAQNFVYLFDAPTVIAQAQDSPLSGAISVTYSFAGQLGPETATLTIPVSVQALPPTQQTVQVVEELRPQDLTTLVVLSVMIVVAVVVFHWLGE